MYKANDDDKNNLNELRIKINDIDQKIFLLFEKRLMLVKKIIKIKLSNNIPILDKEREKKIIDMVTKKTKHKEFIPSVKKLIKSIINISRDFQKNISNNNS
jgi:monofunctional chorismate mutase